MSRILAAAKIHLLLKNNIITQVITVFVLAYAIASLVTLWVRWQGGSVEVAPGVSGGAGTIHGALIGALYVTAMVIGAYAVPHALSLSYSRRVFLIGLYLVFLASSVLAGLFAALGAWAEDAFDGYGIGQYTLAIPYLMDTGGAFAVGLFTAAAAMFFQVIGVIFPMLYKRMGMLRLWILIAALLLVGILLAAWAQIAGAWPAVGEWFAEQNGLTWAGWLTLGTLALTVANWVTIRRLPAV